MTDPGHLALFCVAALALALSPGPDTFYVIARGMSQGSRAGVWSAMGICTGILFHICGAALGLSVILRTSAAAYHVLRYAGAAYLIWIGFRGLSRRESPAPLAAPARASLGRVYSQGILTNVFNPKVALFFLAFLPQFATGTGLPVAVQMMILGLVVTGINVVWLGAIGLMAGRIGAGLMTRARSAGLLNRVSGGILIGLGIRLAWPESP